jgi:hypothetical protein
MMTTVGFLLGFASGWAVRSTVDSASGLAAKTVGLVLRTRSRLVRWAAVEREQIADLIAEVEARYEQASAKAEPAERGNGAQ